MGIDLKSTTHQAGFYTTELMPALIQEFYYFSYKHFYKNNLHFENLLNHFSKEARNISVNMITTQQMPGVRYYKMTKGNTTAVGYISMTIIL